jgi:hypothetical protein
VAPINPGPPGPTDPGPPARTNLLPPGPTPAPALAEGLLARRVPQAHLAPELRRDGQATAAEGQRPDAAEARAALSRYQASRQAARAVVEEEGGTPAGRVDDLGPEPSSSGSGWS